MSAATTTSVQEQRATIRALRQGVAAELVGISARHLRDSTDAPRNVDGTYPGPELVAWARSRIAAVELDADEYERVLIGVEAVAVEEYAPALGELLDDLRESHGDGGIVAFFALLTKAIREDPYTAPTFDAGAAQRYAELHERHARLEVAVICDGCGRLRRGREWADAPPPDGHEVMRGLCRVCESRESPRPRKGGRR